MSSFVTLGAPVIFFPKKDGRQKMCVDYSSLNEVTSLRTSTPYFGLMICLTNLRELVCSPRLIFDLYIISSRLEQ
jgi:hypothetical protein